MGYRLSNEEVAIRRGLKKLSEIGNPMFKMVWTCDQRRGGETNQRDPRHGSREMQTCRKAQENLEKVC